MGKGRPRAVEKGVLGHYSSSLSSGSLAIPQAPVYYPTEEEFQDPLEFIDKIRPEVESYGICRIVPPKSWNPPFALNIDSFTFPTKTQAIHRLQARAASCDPDTFELEYNRFLEGHCGRKPKKRASVVFEGGELDLCRLFNAVKRYGGYDKVVKEKKWGEVFRFVRGSDGKKKITECAKHVLCQLYHEHLYDYEVYHSELDPQYEGKKCKRRAGGGDRKNGEGRLGLESKRRRGNAVKHRVMKEEVKEFDQICEQCRSGLHGEVMLLCDRCDKGWHLYCLSPPLERVPPGNWYCLECVNSNKDSFGFVPGKHFSLENFRKLADRAKRKWFGTATSPTRMQIEKRFWEIVEGSVGKVEVMYGSDLDTSLYGSGFPRANDPLPASVELEAWKKYCTSPWNLNNLPKLPGSMLRKVHDNIAGVMVPWLYVGMLFSSFCWHFEDHCFYSMNYLHWGEPKCWYSVPGGEAHAFEQVMRKTLPDLFDAQPDLLFQLVTMLNPSVLQENGVPVYGVVQEPGNFVVTFPRSFHGGFNFGLNCAEAVNFAPADWLPHGGFGAELYRMYHKAAVLSHEELLCVVAKTNCTSKVSPYLREEFLRIYAKEKTCRENLWRNGVVTSSLMSPKKHAEYVGTEEDPTCIICQQYLYLSAVSCSCRPSALVCVEHWEHFCECNPSKHCLLYRHTLAELNDLVLMVDPSTTTRSMEETPQSTTNQQQISISYESNALTRKVKGGHVTHAQLAENWLLNSCNILENPFSDSAYISALKGAEQFLWAGHEMDRVRDMTHKLIEAQNWVADIRNCLFKVDSLVCVRDNDMEKVCMNDIERLLCHDSPPCNESGYPRLKEHAEGARLLLNEIKSVLLSCSCVTIAELEVLHSRAINLPIFLEESVRLGKEISSAKVWIQKVKECLSERRPASIDLDDLHKLKSEMLELCVQLPEMDLLVVLLRQVESWQSRCSRLLKGPIMLKELEDLLEEADTFTIQIPELKLLRQYHTDTLSWLCHCREVLVNIQEREDYSRVVEELTSILNAGSSLRITVDELPHVEVELKRSCCRENASKVLSTRMSLEFIQHVMSESSSLQIVNEKLFLDISGVLVAARTWEEKAKHLLQRGGEMSEFEEALRTSENIYALLPSLDDIKSALSMAESWIRGSQPFLLSTVCSGHVSGSLLKVDALKELLAQSKILKVSLKAPEMLLTILKNVESWEQEASNLLDQVDSLFFMKNVDIIDNGLIARIEVFLSRIDSATQSGISLGFEFSHLPRLQNASSILQWSLKVLFFCSRVPSIKEVDSWIEDAERLPSLSSCNILSTLIDGTRWLRQAIMAIPDHHNQRKCKLRDVEEVLEKAQRIKIQFPLMVARLQNAIEKHLSWKMQVDAFFNSKLGEESCSTLMQLQECGESNALDSPELEMVALEVGKVKKWLNRCMNIVGSPDNDLFSLPTTLMRIKDSLDMALSIYRSSKACRFRDFCICSSSDSKHEMFLCSTCEDRYHLSCLRPALGMVEDYACPFCLHMEFGAVSRNGSRSLLSRRKRPTLDMFAELLHDAKHLCGGVKEREMVEEILEQALLCKSYMTGIVNCALAAHDKDLSYVSGRLLTALKAVIFSAIYDEDSCRLELALFTNSWKVKVKKLFGDSRKPFIQEIHRMLKEGLTLKIPFEDHFMQKLMEMKRISLQWVNLAKKVAFDSGKLELEKVFDLINEGENLPVHFEKELKLLRARSVLYCVCRKPYDHRAMIACDQCDEWYHFECINLRKPSPKTFLCPACKPLGTDTIPVLLSVHQEERSRTDDDLHTPPSQHIESKRRRESNCSSSLQPNVLPSADLISILRCSSETNYLWRKGRRPLRRTARKRLKFESLSPFFH